MIYYKSLLITDVFIEQGYKFFDTMLEVNPSVEEILQYLIEFKKDRRKIISYLERKDDEEIEERNLYLSIYDN
jgi:hypothetical protein